ncbi:hypothetical protein [Thiothrix unzii]|jgi:hypothetical protein|uniref:Uncharacterized protein n=1 Tax=Thiothrix unzii TaxID=111769 RepID=A0A975IIX7_9GAMM|nr:hypothetical protein [Thiothrix unzii]QTR55447.1 hypothetical protein J9260_18170 [Thiothrix unzii]
MADLSKLKKRNRFGDPPQVEAAGDNLSAPEVAPIALAVIPNEATVKLSRPARKTGRTEAFGTRVSGDFLKEFKRIAFEDDLKFVELLELSLEAYKIQRKITKSLKA